MDDLFSIESKALIGKSREIAISMGYDYVSTIHIFLADCETPSSICIKKFAFTDDAAYIKFKKDHTLPDINYLDNLNDSIPLTKEAESAIRQGLHEMKATGSDMTYPFHILLGCFKAEASLLAACFRDDPNVVDHLMNYYKALGVFEPTSAVNSDTTKPGIFRSFLRRFKK